MGNSYTANPLRYSSDPKLTLSEENLKHISTKKYTQLGNIDEFKHAVKNQVLFRKEIVISDKAQLTTENVEKLKARLNLRHENLLDVYGFSVNFVDESLCELAIFFEQFSSDAATEFQARSKEKDYFAEEELEESLISVIKALSFLEMNKIRHGNLTPEAIFMSNDGEIKLLEFSLFGSPNVDHKKLRNCYIAPEVFSQVGRDKSFSVSYDPWKADLFSVGMIFIYGALLEEPSACYHWGKHVFDAAKLLELHQQIRSKYLGRFANLLLQITAVDPNKRPSPQALLNDLSVVEKRDSAGRTTIIVPEKSNNRERIDEIVNRIRFQSRVSGNNHRSPLRKEVALRRSKDRFRDPKVSQIIQEVKATNWERFTPYNQRTRSRSKSPPRESLVKDLRDSDLRRSKQLFLSSQLSPFHDQTSKGGFVFEPSKITREGSPDRPYNSPKVNKIIDEIKETTLKNSGLYGLGYSSFYLESRKPESTAKSSSFLGSATRLQTDYPKPSKTPERQTSLKDWPEFPAENFNRNSPQTKSQTKQEIIQDLRAEYGRKSKIPNEKKEEIAEVLFHINYKKFSL